MHSWKPTKAVTIVISVLALGLMAMAEKPAEQTMDDKLFEFQIETGRLEVLQDRAAEAYRIVTEAKGGSGEYHAIVPINCENCEDDSLVTLQSSLKATLESHNALRSAACKDGLIGADICSMRLDSSWLSTESKGVLHTIEGLRARSVVAAQVMFPLWGELCAQAEEITGDDLFCSVE